MSKNSTKLWKIQRIRESRQSEYSGGDFYATLFARNSTRLTNAIVSAAFEERLLYRDAPRLLGVKVKTLESIANKLEMMLRELKAKF